MKNNLDHYPHRTDASDHPKCRVLRQKFGWEGFGKFWALCDIIGNAENCKYDLGKPFNRINLMGRLEFQDDKEMVDFIDFLASENCELIQKEGDFLTTETAQEALGIANTKRERDRERVMRRWSKSPAEKYTDEENRQRNNTTLQEIADEKIQTKLKETKLKETKEKKDRSKERGLLNTLEIHTENKAENIKSPPTEFINFKSTEFETIKIPKNEYENLILELGDKNLADRYLKKVLSAEKQKDFPYPNRIQKAIDFFRDDVYAGKIKSTSKIKACSCCKNKKATLKCRELILSGKKIYIDLCEDCHNWMKQYDGQLINLENIMQKYWNPKDEKEMPVYAEIKERLS